MAFQFTEATVRPAALPVELGVDAAAPVAAAAGALEPVLIGMVIEIDMEDVPIAFAMN